MHRPSSDSKRRDMNQAKRRAKEQGTDLGALVGVQPAPEVVPLSVSRSMLDWEKTVCDEGASIWAVTQFGSPTSAVHQLYHSPLVTLQAAFTVSCDAGRTKAVTAPVLNGVKFNKMLRRWSLIPDCIESSAADLMYIRTRKSSMLGLTFSDFLDLIMGELGALLDAADGTTRSGAGRLSRFVSILNQERGEVYSQ